VFTELLPRKGSDEDHRKHRSSIVTWVYVAGVTYQRPLLTELPLSNRCVRHNIVESIATAEKDIFLDILNDMHVSDQLVTKKRFVSCRLYVCVCVCMYVCIYV
jgi:hypothetical protein